MTPEEALDYLMEGAFSECATCTMEEVDTVAEIIRQALRQWQPIEPPVHGQRYLVWTGDAWVKGTYWDGEGYYVRDVDGSFLHVAADAIALALPTPPTEGEG